MALANLLKVTNDDQMGVQCEALRTSAGASDGGELHKDYNHRKARSNVNLMKDVMTEVALLNAVAREEWGDTRTAVCAAW